MVEGNQELVQLEEFEFNNNFIIDLDQGLNQALHFNDPLALMA